MDMQNQLKHLERNPKTHAQHRKEVFWQITLPIVIGVLLALAALAGIIISATRPASELSRWADVSLIWLILPSLFFALLILIVMIGLVVAFTYLLRLVPRYACILQDYFEMGKKIVSDIADKIVGPIIKFRGSWESIRWAGRRVRHLLDKNQDF
jgi:hypothetical protein